MLDSIIHYLQMRAPPSFHPDVPSILSVGYYPIRIVLAEWNFYTHLTSRCSKYYEYSIRDMASRLHDEDIVDLQRWRRRSKRSQQKLSILSESIASYIQYEDEKRPWMLVLKDIDYLQAQLRDYSQSLEQMVTVATSIVQLLDSRRSILEAVNIRRLTYIALVFVPLAWVASLFSMSDAYSPGHERFWVYFATALPLLGFVIILAIIPYDQLRKRLERVWNRVRNIQERGYMRKEEVTAV